MLGEQLQGWIGFVEKNLDALLCLRGPVGSKIQMEVQEVGFHLQVVEINCSVW